MSAVASTGVSEEAARSWRMLAERIATETDPRVRANLEIVARHVVIEVSGDVEALMTTLVPEPEYSYFGVGFPGPRGYAEVKASYEIGVQYGTNRLEFELSRVVADAETVVTEGTFRQAYTGAMVQQMGGSSDEPLDPDGWYLAEYAAIVVWPIAESGLIAGENVYFGEKARVIKPLAPGEMAHLGPVGRSAQRGAVA
jgi:limonene-1,2-epoxide hydrolase